MLSSASFWLFVGMRSKLMYTRVVRARLSLAGLAAACFETRERNDFVVEMVEGLFESRRGTVAVRELVSC